MFVYEGHVDWITYTSLPREWSYIWILNSPSANLPTFAFARLLPRYEVIYRASGQLELPEYIINTDSG